MTPPLVSVVIPTYNYGRYIGETIDSALSQTHSPLEIIVVDDGSTDDTQARVSTFADRIRYIHQQNRGLSAARNKGIQEARGEFIALLDSDDLWLPDKLQRQVAHALQHPDTGLVATERFAIDETGRRIDHDVQACARDGFHNLTMRDLLELAAFSPSSVMIRKEALKLIGGFNETIMGTEDLEMWVRIAAQFPVARLDAALTAQRFHATSMSHQADSMLRSHRRAINELFARVPQLREHQAWRRVAEARMYRELAFLRHSTGDRAGAITDLLRSGCCWPFALRDRQLNKKHLQRCRMFLRYSLVTNRPREGAR
ncbi:MAG TPA: glycosyltransferase family A protein [Verrucomicrobiae bacterium]|nr:glycosyltransferase family A protein [Verrucomicrobiae bacterium]